jgi:hypothetical protein
MPESAALFLLGVLFIAIGRTSTGQEIGHDASVAIAREMLGIALKATPVKVSEPVSSCLCTQRIMQFSIL